MADSVPFFSVCIPAYNGEKFIRTAIDSVLAQTFTDWELIIVDDVSTDRTWEILQEYKDHPKIRLARNPRNRGLGGNLNCCLDLARGHWVALLAEDDIYVPHLLETIHSQIAHRPELILWISDHSSDSNHTTPNMPVGFSTAKEFEANEFAETLFLHGGMFGEISNFAFNRDRYRQTCTHRFLEETTHTDGDFWIRLMRANPDARALFWPEVLVYVTTHDQSISSIDARTGRHVVEIFHSTELSISAGWSRKTLLRQMARMLWVNLKFFSVLPCDEKFRGLKTARLLCQEILRS